MDIGEVVICFGDRVVRGNCSIKYNVFGFNAFITPQIHSLGEIGSYVRLFEHRIRRDDNSIPDLFLDFDQNIVFFHPISGLNNSKILQTIIDNSIHLSGLVLPGFGSANLPGDMLPLIQKIAPKIPVLTISACAKGTTQLGEYKVGKNILDAGVIAIIGITYESATQKMMYAVGKAKKLGLTAEEEVNKVSQMLLTPINKDIEY